MPTNKKIDVKALREEKSKGAEKKSKKNLKKSVADEVEEESEVEQSLPKNSLKNFVLSKPKSTAEIDTEDDTEDDEDEDIFADLQSKRKGKMSPITTNIALGIVGVVAVVGLLVGGVFIKGLLEDDQGVVDNPVVLPSQSVTQQPSQQPQETPTPSDGPPTPSDMGIQDFSQNTTMSASDTLVNPDKYVEDIYGLTTRVDYTVSKISYLADFVSYVKHRGTWGGGLELYWLEATYKGNKYVVQVPFVYYKELDDEGIVPVKMEVLTIQGSAQDEWLSIVSYMCLDVATLQAVQQAQQ